MMITDTLRLARLALPTTGAPVDMVLDTDTYNEIDDQFALGYAMLSPERIRLHAVYAAPFLNERSTSPGDGMSKSHAEILEVFAKLSRKPEGKVFRGSERWMKDAGGPVQSPAMKDLIDRAMARSADDPPLYVVAIGAPTNVASAILACPELMTRIVVVWLGGHPSYWQSAHEFNLQQDIPASKALFDSGVPLVHVPCVNVAQKLRTSVAELRQHIGEGGPFAAFLLQRFAEYEAFETTIKMKHNAGRPIAYNKEIWDVANIAWLIDPSWCPSAVLPTPILTDRFTWSHDPYRHLCREVRDLNRDAIFGDMFMKIRKA